MQNIRKRALSLCMAVLFATALFLSCLTGAMTAAAADDYHTWRQADPRWGNVGMNGSTVARSGCLITSISIMIMHSNSLDDRALNNLGIRSPEEFNPGVLANAYSARGAFTYGGGIASWGTINQIVPNVTFVRDSYLSSYTKSDVAAEIKAMMDRGSHVILNANGHHWVYIEGIIGDEIYMIDPADDSPLLFDVYSPFYGNEFWEMKCANPPGEFVPPAAQINAQEYYCRSGINSSLYASDDLLSEKRSRLIGGSVINIGLVENGFGLVVSEGADGSWKEAGWVRMSDVVKADDEEIHMYGDINNDGMVDMYDLALFNEYVSSLGTMPEWASVFRECEKKASDLNGDGLINNDDLILFLQIICT